MTAGIVGVVAAACLFMAFAWVRLEAGCRGDCGACSGACERDGAGPNRN